MPVPSHDLIHQFLEKSAQLFPDKVALVHGDTRATYAEVNSKANRLADWLREQGVRQGDRVVLLAENCLEYVVSYYGALKAGAAVVPLSSDLKPESLRPLLAELESEIVISSFRFERLLQATDPSRFHVRTLLLNDPKLAWSSTSLAVHELNEVVRGGQAANPDLPIPEDDLANIIYTSGSTGKPKGVMLSHRNIVANTHSICRYLQLTDADIQMVILPFFYVMGKSLLNTHFAAGGTVVINNKFAFPASVLSNMVDEAVTGFSGVPSTYAYLLHRSPLAKQRDKLHALRYCSQAGGHMSRAIKEELRRVLPAHTRIYIMYGATEASARLSYLAPEAFEHKMDSIGKAIPDVCLDVLDEHGRKLPPGERGELVASGPNIMMGYWRDPEATRRVLDEKGYHTGDLAYSDDEGYFHVVGRNDDLLKVGGHRINPMEIEDALMESDLLTEVVVQGVPDALLGHKLVAIAVSRAGDCTENDILGFCAGRLPKYKVPSQVAFVRALPKSPSGKIDRGQCLALLERKPSD
jgi:acyl-CoA synthetase (AMP-forming)/AMP-acid ligase II